MTKIFKNHQNDTLRVDVAPDASWTEIGEAELVAICEAKRVVPEPIDPRVERLTKIDEEAALTPRAFRELVILMTEGFRLATSGTLDLKAIVPGVAQVFALEEEAATIRNQLSSGD